MSKLIIAAIVLISILQPTKNDDLRVIDGDTIVFDGMKVRFACIDAPESKQPYGAEATKQLRQIIGDRAVSLSIQSTDKYGRKIAWVILDDKDTANVEMVKRGYAWWYEYYCKDYKRLDQLQKFAQLNELGLWQGNNPINPYEWRKKD